MNFFSVIWTCNNNAAKYEALYLGLCMGIRFLIVHGDSELVINEVQDKISEKHHYLKIYKNRVWDLLEYFIAIHMIAILTKYNQIVDALIRRGARLSPTFHKREAYRVKVLCIPSILDTANFW